VLIGLDPNAAIKIVNLVSSKSFTHSKYTIRELSLTKHHRSNKKQMILIFCIASIIFSSKIIRIIFIFQLINDSTDEIISTITITVHNA
jgi:hypothetical protein